ncbi:MAG: sulfotransferase [Anaerolineae bacterium]|nr:sulfotransferase [Anaerolineae bacterium]
MTLKVIGAGFGRTGTVSIKAALEELGFGKCYHMVELLQQPEQVVYWEAASRGEAVDWDTLFAGYQASIDFPSYRYYREQLEHFPEAKVLLSVRDSEKWYESALNTIYRAEPGLGQKLLLSIALPFSPRLRQIIRIFRMGNRDVWQNDFQGRFEDKAFAIKVYNRHNETVRQIVPPEKLLVYEVKEGWDPLCHFLNVPVPDGKPFPHLNDRAAFKQAGKVLNLLSKKALARAIQQS